MNKTVTKTMLCLLLAIAVATPSLGVTANSESGASSYNGNVTAYSTGYAETIKYGGVEQELLISRTEAESESQIVSNDWASSNSNAYASEDVDDAYSTAGSSAIGSKQANSQTTSQSSSYNIWTGDAFSNSHSSARDTTNNTAGTYGGASAESGKSYGAIIEVNADSGSSGYGTESEASTYSGAQTNWGVPFDGVFSGSSAEADGDYVGTGTNSHADIESTNSNGYSWSEDNTSDNSNVGTWSGAWSNAKSEWIIGSKVMVW